MLKASLPVLVFFVSVAFGVAKFESQLLWTILVISVGVIVVTEVWPRDVLRVGLPYRERAGGGGGIGQGRGEHCWDHVPWTLVSGSAHFLSQTKPQPSSSMGMSRSP